MKNTKKIASNKKARREKSAPENPVVQPALTTLLFPYVTNSPGFDTLITITNFTAEPFCETPQYGRCSIHFFGNVASGPTPGTLVTGAVPPGGQIHYLLGGGGSVELPPARGFLGYLIVECWFKNARGFAMIADAGCSKLATGYLAEVIPNRKVMPDR
jgi:hypothetical protein